MRRKKATVASASLDGDGIVHGSDASMTREAEKAHSKGIDEAAKGTKKRTRRSKSKTKKKKSQQQQASLQSVNFCQEIAGAGTEEHGWDEKGEHKGAFTVECEICCSTDVATDQITICTSGHIFCKSCARQMAETQLGLHRSDLPCMSMEGCTASFEETEIRGFLDATAFQLWQRLRFEDDLKAAGVGDLERCPSCHFACVIENEHERLFHCLNSCCRRVSCRSCKREEHLPKSCHEYAKEIRERDRHRAEELLSAVLVRRCPQKDCHTPIVKEETSKSCNRMKCTVCKKEMCYVCRQDISAEGYRHFDMVEEAYPSLSSDKCPLWEDTLERHKKDLEAARQQIGKEAPKNTDIDRADEARKRQLLEMQTQADLELEFAGLHLDVEHAVDTEVYNFRDRSQSQWDTHKIARQRKQSSHERHQRDAWQQKAELLAHRQHAHLHRSMRMEALGMVEIITAPKKARRWQLGEPIHL